MKVLKFGGTSVGSAERMKKLVPLLIPQQPCIVVLSAMSGTTNALVDIAQALYQKENEKAAALIEALENRYNAVVEELYSSEAYVDKGYQLIRSHFDYLKAFTI